MSAWWCEHAWLGADEFADGELGADELGADEVTPGVLVEVDGDRITAVTRADQPPAGAHVLRGITLPGFANVHSHAFHRALRGRTHAGRGTFWTWREQMYTVAARLDPDSYLALARAAFAEMALAGITCVGEFHYLHHGPTGAPYAEANAMGDALVEAARGAGVRLTLLDTCYLTGGIGARLEGPQRRFGDGDADGWVRRAEELRRTYVDAPDVRIGAALHSVRAVPPAQMPAVVGWARQHGLPLHAHLSEQRAENEACLAAYGRTPTRLLADTGALGERMTAVHATHLTGDDIATLGATGTGVCLCPTTERDLADGIGPARRLADAGVPLSLGSDSHAVVDLFEEARAVELDERLASQVRGHFSAGALLHAATGSGHAALGWRGAGRIAPGAHADLVAVRLDSPRTGGCGITPQAVVFAASAADVTDVVVGGQAVVADGQHLLIEDVGRSMQDAVAEVLT